MSELTKDGLEYLVETGKKLTPVEQLEFDGRHYTRQEIKPVNEPLVTALQISTLQSLIELLSEDFGGHGFEGFDPATNVIHVMSEKQVQVVSAQSNAWKNREILVNCLLTEVLQFPFGQFLTQDKFIIGLLSSFTNDGDRDDLARLAGAAKAEAVTLSHDDGIAQEITVKGGAHLVDKVAAKNLVQLAPYRTFRDVAQPISQFLFRVQQSGENMPTFALFESDGGKWKLDAIASIAAKLSAGLTNATVVS
jgi:hypothetical protein